MMRIWIGVLIVLLIQSCNGGDSRTVSEDRYFRIGNQFYKQRSWDSAIHYYQLSAPHGEGNPALYYNLGNAWYRMGKYGQAVLAYRKALKRNPDFRPAIDNLALAQTKAKVTIVEPEPLFFQRWWQRITGVDMIGLWAIAAWLFFTLAIGAFVGKRILKKGSLVSNKGIIGLSLAWVLCLVLAYYAASSAKSLNEAVVITDKAQLWQSASQSAPIGKLSEGTIIKILKTGNGLVYIELPDGQTGWIASINIAVVD